MCFLFTFWESGRYFRELFAKYWMTCMYHLPYFSVTTRRKEDSCVICSLLGNLTGNLEIFANYTKVRSTHNLLRVYLYGDYFHDWDLVGRTLSRYALMRSRRETLSIARWVTLSYSGWLYSSSIHEKLFHIWNRCLKKDFFNI